MAVVGNCIDCNKCPRPLTKGKTAFPLLFSLHALLDERNRCDSGRPKSLCQSFACLNNISTSLFNLYTTGGGGGSPQMRKFHMLMQMKGKTGRHHNHLLRQKESQRSWSLARSSVMYQLITVVILAICRPRDHGKQLL